MKPWLREIQYSFYLAVHPFKGFWGIKHEGAGSVRAATVLLVLYTLVSVLSAYFTGYLFSPNAAGEVQPARQAFTILALFFGYCIANWAFTCLFDGEGTFADIYRATGYALLPLILTTALLIPMSNFFVMEEQAFYTTISSLGAVWTAFLLLISVLVTHNYSLGKGLGMILCIGFGMCVIAYIALLFFNLLQQMIGFVVIAATEFTARYL